MDKPTSSQDEALVMAVACNPGCAEVAAPQAAHKLLSGSATAQALLRDKLDDARSAVEEIDSFIHVCRLALEAHGCELGTDVGAVLRVAHDKAKVAGNSVKGALGLLWEASRG